MFCFIGVFVIFSSAICDISQNVADYRHNNHVQIILILNADNLPAHNDVPLNIGEFDFIYRIPLEEFPIDPRNHPVFQMLDGDDLFWEADHLYRHVIQNRLRSEGVPEHIVYAWNFDEEEEPEHEVSIDTWLLGGVQYEEFYDPYYFPALETPPPSYSFNRLPAPSSPDFIRLPVLETPPPSNGSLFDNQVLPLARVILNRNNPAPRDVEDTGVVADAAEHGHRSYDADCLLCNLDAEDNWSVSTEGRVRRRRWHPYPRTSTVRSSSPSSSSSSNSEISFIDTPPHSDNSSFFSNVNASSLEFALPPPLSPLSPPPPYFNIPNDDEEEREEDLLVNRAGPYFFRDDSGYYSDTSS